MVIEPTTGVRAATRFTAERVPILTYHSLDDSGSVISTSPALFRWQIESLARRGFTGITLSTLLEGWDGAPLPAGKPIVLTFDDGYASLAEHALPVLEDHGFEATVFVIAGHVGGVNDWPGEPASVPRLGLLSESALRELAAGPFEVGAHGVRHLPLPALSEADARSEIVDAKQYLEDRIGWPVETFAYPYGIPDARQRELLVREFSGACGVRMAVARRDDDRYALPRLDAYYLRGRRAFRRFGTRLGNFYLRCRAAGRAARVQFAGLRL